MEQGRSSWKEIFSFSSDHISNLCVEQTPFGLEESGASGETATWDKLVAVQKRLIRSELHRLSLIEYLRRQHIPRGLRVYKEPRLFATNAAFLSKWNCILNKCSCDLMVLIVDTAKLTLEDLNKEAQVLLDELKSKETDINFKSRGADMSKQLDQLREEVKVAKAKKLKWDYDDYTSGYVYPWMNPNRKFQRRQRQRAEFDQSTDDSSSGGSARSVQSAFLDEGSVQEKKGGTRSRPKPRGGDQ